MPKKFLRRWLPAPQFILNNKWLGWLGPVIGDPNLFHLTRHSVSMAFLAGIFVAFLPLPGHVIIVAILAIVLHCNLPISLMLVWISNPLTMAPLLALCYQVGIWVLNRPSAFVEWQFTWSWLSEQGPTLIVPLFIGSIISGLACGLVGFVSVRVFWRWRVISRWEARKRFRQSRPTPPAGE